ncbi:hypothetical protein Gogos_011544, partial [Gossypium gossypioides]|nr:hypothetical protein [Gossypium gossypioides]
MKENRLLEIINSKLLNDGNVKHLKEVASLARRYVRMKGEERPSMKEVAHELAGLQAINQPWGNIIHRQKKQSICLTLPSDEGRLISVLTAFAVDVVTELVPLEGDEDGVGNFLGSICSQYSLGNLDDSERTMKARREMPGELHLTFKHGFRRCVAADMLSNLWRLPTC